MISNPDDDEVHSTQQYVIMFVSELRQQVGGFLPVIRFPPYNEGGVVRVHPKTIQRYLHKNKIFRRVVRKKMVVREVSKKKGLSWCLERRR